MHLIAPDVLTEARGLTGAMAGTVCVLGIALWVFGWRWHRFWVVAGITLAAGLIGLTAGRGAGNNTPVMAIGVLLAITAGMLALELAKILAFVAGGVGAWLAVQWVLPQAQELWAVFLCGGLFGVLMYRLWTMMLTSLAGTLLAGHAGLLLLEPVLKFDAAAWAAANLSALNGFAVGFIVLGILVQAAASRDEEAKKDADEKKDEEHDDDHDHEHKEKPKKGRKKFRLFGKAA
jgi:hypothetical protein